MKAAKLARTRAELGTAIDAIADAIRGAWSELRTENDVMRAATGMAGQARGMCMHTVVVDYKAGRDPFSSSFNAD
jgi:hypothetical protein